jgi:hypothetical protein
VAKFRALGYDEVYTEPVKFTAWRRLFESAEVIAPITQRLAVTALGNSVGNRRPARCRDLGTGAVDDGFGVALTIAAGALIKQLPQAPRRHRRATSLRTCSR